MTVSGQRMKTNVLAAIRASETAYASIPYTETGTNHQRFSDAVNAAGLAGYQNAPWCATYQFAVDLETVGVDQALKHWNMTRATYRGYNCFETEAAFAKAGKTGNTPRPGALVIFKQSHMGRVLSVSGNTFSCGEGNTSNAQFDRNGDSCAVKTYSANDPKIRSFCYIDYPVKEMTANDIIKACANVYLMAHNGKYNYGNSQSLPPCADGLISCDRMVSRALWDLEFTNQPKGGFTVSNEKWMGAYLQNWGFIKVTDVNALKPGDIVIMRNGSTTPNAGWHTFVLTAFTSPAKISKYDCGGSVGNNWRIEAKQPFVNVPLNEWGGGRAFYCAYRCGSDETQAYSFNPGTVKTGSTGAAQFLANRILKARNYKGVKKDGVEQEIELNNAWTVGDVAALVKYKWDRIINGKNLCKNINGDVINNKVWQDLTGMTLPLNLPNVPDKTKTGVAVLLLQEILKSENFNGKDGKPLVLDQQYGENTRHALIEYQKTYGLAQTGNATYSVWRHMLTNATIKPH